jgi:hypothetical protein
MADTVPMIHAASAVFCAISAIRSYGLEFQFFSSAASDYAARVSKESKQKVDQLINDILYEPH